MIRLFPSLSFFFFCSFYVELRQEGLVPDGLDTTMILVVDKAAMDLLLNPTPGRKPWVWACDATAKFEVGDRLLDDPPRCRYPGYFRVDPVAAFTRLWPLLKGPQMFVGSELWNPDRVVWRDITSLMFSEEDEKGMAPIP